VPTFGELVRDDRGQGRGGRPLPSRQQLALSTQCGFATDEAGNEITEDEQRSKLSLVSAMARQL
jgi:hypothetical protein